MGPHGREAERDAPSEEYAKTKEGDVAETFLGVQASGGRFLRWWPVSQVGRTLIDVRQTQNIDIRKRKCTFPLPQLVVTNYLCLQNRDRPCYWIRGGNICQQRERPRSDSPTNKCFPTPLSPTAIHHHVGAAMPRKSMHKLLLPPPKQVQQIKSNLFHLCASHFQRHRVV